MINNRLYWRVIFVPLVIVIVRFESMIIENLKKQKQSILNGDFELVYSTEIMALSNQHWTPSDVIKETLNFLCIKENSKIIDIGSGVGKFCISGAVLKPKCSFYGVECREKFVDISIKIKDDYRIDNSYFINRDFSAIDFNNFNGVYFFNSFQENIDDKAVIDELSQLSYDLYTTNSHE